MEEKTIADSTGKSAISVWCHSCAEEKCRCNSTLKTVSVWMYVLICGAGTATCIQKQLLVHGTAFQTKKIIHSGMYPSPKISTTALNDLLNNKIISPESLLWLSSGTAFYEEDTTQRCVAFFWTSFAIKCELSLNWQGRICVCLIMEQCGVCFSMHWWWLLCSILENVVGKRWVAFDQQIMKVEIKSLISLLNIHTAGHLKYFHLNSGKIL